MNRRSLQLRGMAFESERLYHLPYMEISSNGAYPFVWSGIGGRLNWNV